MREDIYDALKSRIVEGFYRPGELIRESDVAQEFQVSRTPVREIFQNLQRDRLITLIPNRGAQVTYLELDFFMELVVVKRAMESLSVRLACRWATAADVKALREIVERCKGYQLPDDYLKVLEDDAQFHRSVCRAGRNRLLGDLMRELEVHMDRFYFFTEYITQEMLQEFIRDFEVIIQAIEERDGDRASRAAEAHLDQYYDIIKERLRG